MTDRPALADRIAAVLPQTQCTKCGYDGCLPYATAIAAGGAEINQCPPGGPAGIAQLAAVTGRPILPLNRAHGAEQPLRRAIIDEALCIGCTLCIQACPVDAIVGAPRVMHSVIAAWCNGCDLCVAPCPMDCIAMVPVAPARDWTRDDARSSLRRFEERRARLARETAERDATRLARAGRSDRADHTRIPPSDNSPADEAARRRAVVQAAIARARARRGAGAPP
jgi:electron transport complex protein RnfB